VCLFMFCLALARMMKSKHTVGTEPALFNKYLVDNAGIVLHTQHVLLDNAGIVPTKYTQGRTHMKRRFALMGALILMLATVALIVATAQEGDTGVDERYVGSVPAPAFPADVDWLNVENPLTIEGLQGKIVILDFWTYGCINCIHMIPVLDALSETYEEELVIISVHSAKFDNEGQTENIRQIVQRYNIHHPVINDSDFAVWRTYGVRAWPTFGIIDPRGNVVAMQSGEIPLDAFDQYIASMIQYYDDLGTDELNREPLEVAIEGAGDPGTPLLFPGKVLVDGEGERLFIADSNHHRIVIADLNTYEVLDTIGTGRRGFDDGDYESATFFQPQGMALDSETQTLYVADTTNHAIRALQLDTQTVRTIAGTGNKGRGLVPFGVEEDNPTSFDLRSPWDVKLDDRGRLHIAMAGTHQLWLMDLQSNTIRASVGNGREAQLNSTLADSELAQPSGLHWHEGLLYFCR
jgi:thiol-disulfide isomerase/thioredoxin